MMMQPSPPAVPQAPVLSAQERANLVQGVQDQQRLREVGQVMEQARGELAQARGELAQSGQTGNSSVIKDGAGRIVVTGPDGKTITIDPKAGLDGDQIQAMVQTALQPTERPSDSRGPSKEAVTIVAIVFTFLFLMVVVIGRAMTSRLRVVAPAAAALPREAIDRLARIEQAVEAVAIEVERISEAQRYSAQLLTDRLAGPAPTMPAVAAARGDHG